MMLSQADIYPAAFRLIEHHGDAAEIATVLHADPILTDDCVRERVLKALAELRDPTSRLPS